MSVAKLISVTNEFIQLLKLERKLLKQHKLPEAAALHAEKDRLNGEYHMAVLQLKSEQDAFQNMAVVDIDALSARTIKMKEILEENRELLNIVSKANSRLLFALVQKFASRQQTVQGYTPLGAFVKGPKSTTKPLTVNTCI